MGELLTPILEATGIRKEAPGGVYDDGFARYRHVTAALAVTLHALSQQAETATSGNGGARE